MVPERLSRRDRRRWRLAPALVIILGLLVAVAAFLAFRVYREPEVAPASKAMSVLMPPQEFHARCDSLILRAYDAFGLSDTVAPGQPEQPRGGGGTYRAFKQGWPDELPLLAFVDKLNTLARQDSLGCDCLESPREGWLDCTLLHAGTVGARITLEASPGTNFEDREIALVFEHFTSLSSDVISSLLKSGMMLSYIAGPETMPTGKVRELISKRGITAILRLPASEKGWRDLAGVVGLGKKSGRKPGSGKPDRALIDEALERHPATKLICFDFANGTDWEIVEKITQRAKAKKIALLLTPDQPQEVVNAAGQAGMQIFRAEFPESLEGKPLTGMKNDLMKALISGGPPKGSIACPDTAGLTLENLWLFKTYFEKLGVRFRPLMKLVVPFERPPAAAS